MPSPSVTQAQKKVLQWMVKEAESGNLNGEDILISFSDDGTYVHDVISAPPDITPGTLRGLDENGLLNVWQTERHSYHCALTGASREAVESDFKTPAESDSGGDTYYLSGANSRVYIESSDNSHNVVRVNSEDLFADIREAIEEGVAEKQEQRALLTKLRELESAVGSDPASLPELYAKFMALAAHHAEVMTPFLPALGQLVQGG